MEKEENLSQDIKTPESTGDDGKDVKPLEENQDNPNGDEKKIEPTPEEKIIELEDKLTRTFAEMENQRRRFEKEKDDAFDYGGFSFAKEALKKTLEHFEIISKDMVSIFLKNGITPVISIGRKLDPNQHQAMMEKDQNINSEGQNKEIK